MNRNTQSYVVLEDGRTYSGIENSSVVVPENLNLDINQDISDSLSDGDASNLLAAVENGEIPGTVYSVQDLVRLAEFIGDLKPSDLATPESRANFFDFLTNSPLF